MRRLVTASLCVVLAGGLAGMGTALAEWRMWADRGGANRIEAEFVKLGNKKVTLKRKSDGKQITVELAKLREEDQEYAKKAQAKVTQRLADPLRDGPDLKPRTKVPSVVLLAFAGVREEVGLTIETSSASQVKEIADLVGQWITHPIIDNVLGEGAPRLRPEEIVELILQGADEFEPRIKDLLDAGQKKRLNAARRKYLFPYITRPSRLDYLLVPAVQAELKLTEKQIAALERIAASGRAGSDGTIGVEDLFGEKTKTVDKKDDKKKGGNAKKVAAKQQENELEQAVLDVLAAPQKKRLTEIRYYYEGIAELKRRTQDISRLRLKSDQKENFERQHRQAIVEAVTQYVNPEVSRAKTPDDITRELMENSRRGPRGVIDDAKQQQEWERMVGESFDPWATENTFEKGTAGEEGADNPFGQE